MAYLDTLSRRSVLQLQKDTEEALEKFDGPYIALEVTTHGMACGPVSFTVYFIIDQKYENQLDSMLIMDEA